jgi:hypothetical protein
MSRSNRSPVMVSGPIPWHSVGPIITLYGRITVKQWVAGQPMVQTLFPHKDAVFQHDNGPIHTTRSVQPWFEKHESDPQHLSRSTELLHLDILNHSGQV